MRWAGPLDSHRQRRDATNDELWSPDRQAVQREIGESGDQGAQGRLQLDAGKGCAHAEVDASTEAEMRIVHAVDPKRVRLGEDGRIPICGPQQRRDLLALLNRDLTDCRVSDRCAL